MVSPTTAPTTAAAPTAMGLTASSWWDASNAALTRTISPGSGMPRLSMPMTPPTMKYTASGGIVCSSESTVTPPTMPDHRVACGTMGYEAADNPHRRGAAHRRRGQRVWRAAPSPGLEPTQPVNRPRRRRRRVRPEHDSAPSAGRRHGGDGADTYPRSDHARDSGEDRGGSAGGDQSAQRVAHPVGCGGRRHEHGRHGRHGRSSHHEQAEL